MKQEGINPFSDLLKEKDGEGRSSSKESSYERNLQLCLKAGPGKQNKRASEFKRKTKTQALMNEEAQQLFKSVSRIQEPLKDMCQWLAACFFFICSLRSCLVSSVETCARIPARASKQSNKMTPFAAHEHGLWINSDAFSRVLELIISTGTDPLSRNMLRMEADCQAGPGDATRCRLNLDRQGPFTLQ